MKRTELATAAIRIARSIEAHLTGAVATISQRNQDIVCEADQFVPVVGQGVGHLIFDFVSFLIFKAKAFRFCLFFLSCGKGPLGTPSSRHPFDWLRTSSDRSEGSRKDSSWILRPCWPQNDDVIRF